MSAESIYFKKPIARRRVVITGMGAITPVGLDLESTWSNLLAGKSGIQRITQFDASAYDAQIAGEVNDFDPSEFVSKKDQRKTERFTQFALVASHKALQDAGIEPRSKEMERTGCLIGAGMGGLKGIQDNMKTLLERGPHRISPFFIPTVIANIAAGQVAIQTGAQGPNYSVTSACATGAHAIGEAYHYIQSGKWDYMIAGGSESVVCELGIGGFSSMRALSTRNDDPEAASRPWDEDRDGFVLGEGAGVLFMESYESAAKRGAKIYAEVSGYSATCDAFHITNPHDEGTGAATAMKMALEDAEINPEEVNYINAHGTSTSVGDVAETMAIKKAFKGHAKQLSVSSTKSMTGHLLGAAGAIESIICAMSVYKNVIPPTINLEKPSVECDLDYTPHAPKEMQVNHALNNSFGFGGTNACLIFSKPQPELK